MYEIFLSSEFKKDAKKTKQKRFKSRGRNFRQTCKRRETGAKAQRSSSGKKFQGMQRVSHKT